MSDDAGTETEFAALIGAVYAPLESWDGAGWTVMKRSDTMYEVLMEKGNVMAAMQASMHMVKQLKLKLGAATQLPPHDLRDGYIVATILLNN